MIKPFTNGVNHKYYHEKTSIRYVHKAKSQKIFKKTIKKSEFIYGINMECDVHF